MPFSFPREKMITMGISALKRCGRRNCMTYGARMQGYQQVAWSISVTSIPNLGRDTPADSN
jgi:hypothetical protein